MAGWRWAHTRRRRAGVAAAALAGVFAAAQWVGPGRPARGAAANGPIEAHVGVPAEVDAVLQRACYDCHSNGTRWPAYSRVAPVSWLVGKHVREGRASLDFSDWSTDPTVEPTPEQRLGGICHDLREKIMPPRSYRMMHPSSKVSDDEVRLLCAWAREAAAGLPRHAPPPSTPEPS